MLDDVGLYVFDADGTLRWTRVPGQRWPLHPEEWELMPNVAEVLRALPWGPGLRLGVASNQHGVGLGQLSTRLAHRMIADTLVRAIGYLPDGCCIQMCTCHPGQDCGCRKPHPTMLRAIMRRFAVPAERTVFVGDQEIDREAARRAGTRFVWAAEFFGWSGPREAPSGAAPGDEERS